MESSMEKALMLLHQVKRNMVNGRKERESDGLELENKIETFYLNKLNLMKTNIFQL